MKIVNQCAKTVIRLCYVACMAALLLAPYDVTSLDKKDASDEDFFEFATLEEVGLDEDIIGGLDEYITQNHPGISGVIAIKDNYCVYEKYYNGSNIGSLYEINSVTKTVIGAMVGCAIDRGLIEDENVPFYSITGAECDGPYTKITIKDMLTMSSGIDWDSVRTSIPLRFDVIKYGTDNYFNMMKDFPISNDAGTQFMYDSYESRSTMAALTKLIGKEDYEIVSEYLFDDMGIYNFIWPINDSKLMPGGQDLFLSLRQVAKFGNLYVNEGCYKNHQILSNEWIEKSLTIQTYAESEDCDPADTIGYGYYWWCLDTEEYNIRFAFGAGGEYIFVLPEENLTVVISSIDKLKGENYRDVFLNFFIPALNNTSSKEGF